MIKQIYTESKPEVINPQTKDCEILQRHLISRPEKCFDILKINEPKNNIFDKITTAYHVLSMAIFVFSGWIFLNVSMYIKSWKQKT